MAISSTSFKIGNKAACKKRNPEDPFYMDGGLRKVLGTIKTTLRADDDVVHLIWGQEGSGKSLLGQQLCKEVDPTFNIDRICFSLEEFGNAVKKAKKYQAVLLDEAFELSWRNGMTKLNKLFFGLFMQMRQKNLYIVLIIPRLKELSDNIAIDRTNAAFRVYKRPRKRKDGSIFQERGYWHILCKQNKDYLYECLKKGRIVKEDGFIYQPIRGGRFLNHYVVDEKAYRKKKLDSFEKFQKEVLKIFDEPKKEKKKVAKKE